MTIKSIALLLLPIYLLNPIPSSAQANSRTPSFSPNDTAIVKDKIAIYAKIIRCEDERDANAELLDMLKSKDSDLKNRAILALGRIGNPIAVPQLKSIIDSGDSASMKALAAFSLGEIESETAVPFILNHLEDPALNGELKLRLIEALGKIAANKNAATALGNASLEQMAKAVVACLQVYPKRENASLDECTSVNLIALTALLRMKQRSCIASIIDLLKSSQPDVCWQSANVLARMKDGIEAAGPGLIM
ncbi:MAG: hypothetical protein K2X81_20125, partial [Candidatus Obscuribacterales bacterium]|nr:hypothetical protein [Candidatus Obscuribacterales bacterium]